MGPIPNPPMQPNSGGPGNPFAFGWWEFISRTGSTARGEWTAEDASETMTIDYQDQNVIQVLPAVLGWHKSSGPGGGGGNKIARTCPMRHPRFRWLYATKLTDRHGIDWQFKNTSGNYGPYSSYGLQRATITFQSLPFDVIDDSDLTNQGKNEWDRFVYRVSKTTVQAATIPGNTYQIVNGPSAGTLNAKIKASMTTRIVMDTLIWKWMYVPDNWLFNANRSASAIKSCLGLVNSKQFYGYQPGELLFDGVDWEPINAPIDPQQLGLPDYGPPRLWHVNIIFKASVQPKDPNATYPVLGDGSVSGHLLVPDYTSAGGFWYYATSINQGAGNGGRPLYQSNDFANIFKQAT